MHLALTTIIVEDYDAAIAFYTDALGFELEQDEPSTTDDGRPKRWVVVRPPGGECGVLLAEADGHDQRNVIGAQWAGRVGMFLHVDDFGAAHRRLLDHEVEIVDGPRSEPYGTVLVFLDLAGNRWDLLGPA